MRLAISVKTDLGLRALRVLESDRRVWTASALAQRVWTTPLSLKDALAAFVRAGWVYSGPGPAGGYLWAGPARNPSLLEVIEAIEGPTAPDMCVLRDGKRCGLISGEPICALHEGWQVARDVLVDILQATPAIHRTSQVPAPVSPGVDQLT